MEDPDPDKARLMAKRIRGTPIIGSVPLVVRKLQNRICSWQVKPELITINHSWLTTGQVAGNRKAWGDAEDLVDALLEATKERKAVKLGGEVQTKQRVRQGKVLSTKKAHLDEMLDGQEEDTLSEE